MGTRDIMHQKKLCKYGDNSGKNALICKSNLILMKRKLVIALLIAFVSGIVMTSCAKKTCPAYGESSKYVKETRF